MADSALYRKKPVTYTRENIINPMTGLDAVSVTDSLGRGIGWLSEEDFDKEFEPIPLDELPDPEPEPEPEPEDPEPTPEPPAPIPQ